MSKQKWGKKETTLLHEVDALVEERLRSNDKDEAKLLQKIDAKMKEMDMVVERQKNDKEIDERMAKMDNLIQSMDEKISRMQESNIENRPITSCIEIDKTKESRAMDKNIFSLMLVSQPKSLVWLYGIMIIIFQLVLVALIIHEEVTDSRSGVIWNVPIQVPSYVTFTQFVALILVMLSSNDFISSVKMLCSLYERRLEKSKANEDNTGEETKTKETKDEEKPTLPAQESISLSSSECNSQDSKDQFDTPKWVNTVIPHALQLVVSFLVIFASLVVILQSEEIIQLFVNLTAIQVVSYCSKLGYNMSEGNYFGNKIAEATKSVTLAQVAENKPKRWKKIPIYTYIIVFVFAVIVVVWACVSSAQHNRKYLKNVYNECLEAIGSEEFEKVADKNCHGKYNTPLCGYDGGDCADFNRRWPGCTVHKVKRIGDGICDAGVQHSAYNTKECGFDGGDCITSCVAGNLDLLGNGKCDNYFPYNTAACLFDGGDCESFNLKYKNCKCPKNDDSCSAEDVLYKIEDGICDNYPPYNSSSCKFDGGDCDFFLDYPNCFVDHASWIGDGYCDNFEPFNTSDCGFDAGECIAMHRKYPDCQAPYLEYIGDGFCDGPIWNTPECDYDGGDCEDFEYPDCEAYDYWELGNGRCWDKFPYNTAECGNDGGDCDELEDPYPDCDISNLKPYFKWFPTSVGDNLCELEFNTTECGWDGGDCLKKEKEKKNENEDK